MMLHTKSPRHSYWKLLALLPIVGATLALNAETVTDVVYENDEPQKQVPVKKGKKNTTIKTGSGQDIQIIEGVVADEENAQAYDVETFTIKGKVIDGEDKSPIVGAIVKVVGVTKDSKVQVVSAGQSTVTDKEGNFRLEVAVGDRIAVTYAGYEAYQIGVSKAYAKDRTYMIALYKEGTERDDSRVFDVVEVMPQFPGGPQELFSFLSKTIRYPVEAEKAGTQGRVIVTFVVGKDGSVSNAHIVKSVDPLLDAEALRVINAMPAWTPGTQNGKAVRVKYTVPITFRLDGKTKEAPAAVGIFTPTDSPAREAREDHICKEDGSIVAMDVDMEKSTVLRPLFVVDGKIMDGKEVYAINPKTIERFYMQDGQEAIKKYGDKAKDGVVIITLKK